jgi:hypothetical protein
MKKQRRKSSRRRATVNKIFILTRKPEDWKSVLAEPDKQGLFQNIELLLAFRECQVTLPGGTRPSQNDIFILARGNNQLVSIMVEGKVSEPFGDTIAQWRKRSKAQVFA